jgi:uncharacterized repeat protein (TIGR03803 family)
MSHKQFSAVPGRTWTTLAALSFLLVLIAASATGQTLTTLHHFQLSGGSTGPVGLLLADASGNLYGATDDEAVTGGWGTIFELSAPVTGGGWTYTTLYRFASGTDGRSPIGSLVADAAGNLYGTTGYGGTSAQNGTVFQLLRPTTTGGAWTENVLYRFQGGVTDGAGASSGLIMDAAGNLYGETGFGGPCNNGTVYELSPPASQGGTWTETILHGFQYSCNSNDGSEPSGGLTFGKNGVLFGMTAFGAVTGLSNLGTVFSLQPPAVGQTQWTERIVHSFTAGVDGYNPYGGVTVDNKGNLYGTTYSGGSGTGCTGGCGQIFELSPAAGGAWTRNTLYSFNNGLDGVYPMSRVTLDRAGNLYATTGPGGLGCGTIVELNPPATQGGTWTETNIHPFACTLSDEGHDYSGLILGKNGILYGLAEGNLSVKPPQYGAVFKFQP